MDNLLFIKNIYLLFLYNLNQINRKLEENRLVNITIKVVVDISIKQI